MFEELDHAQTRFGELVLRRRDSPSLGGVVYEVMLGGEHLMSSQVHDSEIALTRLGLRASRAAQGPVLVGGLGLGYTAAAALDDEGTTGVTVIEALPEVIDWHRNGLVPLGDQLTGDTRCSFVLADFFRHMAGPAETPHRAILVDIDHAPDSLLHPDHAMFYDENGLGNVVNWLLPGGSFALWSADAPTPGFLDAMQRTFATCEVHEIDFDNPLTGDDRNFIITGVRAD